MTARTFRRGAAVLAVGLAAAGLSACGGGGGEPADVAAGKATFAACAGCHALADAGSTARVGPNLDDAWRASRQVGIDDSQYAGTIERWIRISQQPMPRNLVKGQDARNVAAYIASVAGKSPDSGVYPATSTPEVPDPPRQDQE